MATIYEINDLTAPEIQLFRSSDAQLRMKQHPEMSMFMAESAKVVGYAMDNGVIPYAFMMERKHIDGQAKHVLSRCGDDIPVYTSDRDTLSSIVGYHPDRCIQCLMYRPVEKHYTQVCTGASRIAVIEDVTDTTNLGAIFRSAAALGIDAVLLTPTCCDPYNRRCVRVSMGTVFQVPWARICNSADEWKESGISELKKLGFKTAALALRNDNISIDNPLLESEEKLALILGTEGDGLSNKTIAGCDYCVKIPMFHGVDSLNVAAAGAVAFWQLRKR